MRLPLLALPLLALAACSPAGRVVPGPPEPYDAPDTTGLAARRAAEQAVIDAARATEAASQARRNAITTGSRGTASVTAARDTRLLDEPALTGRTLAPVDSGEVLQARSYDGRYWGVQRGDDWGYVPESAVVRNDDARRLVTEGPPAPARTTSAGTARSGTGGGSSGSTYGSGGSSGRGASCSAFTTRSEAQAAYDADPSAYAALDTDGDGRACENGVGGSAGRSSGSTGRSTGRSSGRRSSGGGHRYVRGPRGGCYYVNANGNRVYVDHSYCG